MGRRKSPHHKTLDAIRIYVLNRTHGIVEVQSLGAAVIRRPRKTLGFQTPASKLQASVASTV